MFIKFRIAKFSEIYDLSCLGRGESVTRSYFINAFHFDPNPLNLGLDVPQVSGATMIYDVGIEKAT